jgi:hypothetical protein
MLLLDSYTAVTYDWYTNQEGSSQVQTLAVEKGAKYYGKYAEYCH